MPDLQHELVDEVGHGLDAAQDVEAVREGDGEPPDEAVEGRALDAGEGHRVGGGSFGAQNISIALKTQ